MRVIDENGQEVYRELPLKAPNSPKVETLPAEPYPGKGKSKKASRKPSKRKTRAIQTEKAIDYSSRQEKARKIDLAKALQLRARGLNLTEIAQFFGVHPTSVSECLKRYAKGLIKASDLKVLEENRKAIIASAMHGVIPYIQDPASIEKASWLQRVTGFGILHDKLRLEEGKPTSNIAVYDMFELVRQAKREANAMGNDTAEQGRGYSMEQGEGQRQMLGEGGGVSATNTNSVTTPTLPEKTKSTPPGGGIDG